MVSEPQAGASTFGERLNEKSVAQAKAHRPAYPRASLETGIVHLGVGAFHRAHMAHYVDRAIAETSDLRWGIVGASLQSEKVPKQLAPQDGLYALAVRQTRATELHVIGALKSVVHAPSEQDTLLSALASTDTHLISLTVTEKGYCLSPADRALDLAHPDIARDLANLSQPRSAIGWLVQGLSQRFDGGGAPVTVLCCDNLPSNGQVLQAAVEKFAGRAGLGDAFLKWVSNSVGFPCAMVDRIVPATTPADLDAIAAQLGLRDEAAVVAEPFTQWVIEDRFASERPAFGRVGVQLVDSVAPFELMKLRLLNGSHSTLAYLGYLAGYETIADTVADPVFHALAVRLMRDEVQSTLSMPPGVDLVRYQDELMQRFENTALFHRTWQIAMDGTQKLPQRLLNTARERLQQGQSVELIALAVAGWMRYVYGEDEAGSAIDVRDPMAARLRDISQRHRFDAASFAQALLGVKEVFGEDLPKAVGFTRAVRVALSALFRDGSRATVAAAMGLTGAHELSGL